MLIIASCRTQNCPYSENLFVFDFSTVHIGISIIIERLMAPLFNVSPPIIAMCCMNAACRYFLSFFFVTVAPRHIWREYRNGKGWWMWERDEVTGRGSRGCSCKKKWCEKHALHVYSICAKPKNRMRDSVSSLLKCKMRGTLIGPIFSGTFFSQKYGKNSSASKQ